MVLDDRGHGMWVREMEIARPPTANQPLRQLPLTLASIPRPQSPSCNMTPAMPLVCFNSSFRKTLISILSLLGVGVICSASALAQTFTRIASFDGTNGDFVYGPLTQGPDDVYSAANGGGVDNCGVIASCGTIFSVNHHRELKLLHTFCLEDGCPDGSSPFGGLLWTSNGYFYATTLAGGASGPVCASGCGTVYRLNSAGQFETLQNNFRLRDRWEPDHRVRCFRLWTEAFTALRLKSGLRH